MHATSEVCHVWGIRYIDELVLRDQDTTSPINGILNQRHYALQDANFNVVALIYTNGSVGRRFEYDAYGHSITLEADYSPGAYEYDFEYRYAGYRWDYETYLLQVRNRWYHPRLGRWLSRDPLGYDGGDASLYRYCENIPTHAIDPFGTDIATRCPIGEWLRGHGVQSGRPDGWNGAEKYPYEYSWDIDYPPNWSLFQEVLIGMLASETTFYVKGDSSNAAILNLAWHAYTRIAIVHRAKTLSGFSFPLPTSPKSRIKLSADSIEQYISNPDEYTLNCNAAAQVMMYSGILDLIGGGEFDNNVGSQGDCTKSHAPQRT